MAKVPENCLTTYFHALGLLLRNETSTNRIAISLAGLKCPSFYRLRGMNEIRNCSLSAEETKVQNQGNPTVSKTGYLRDVTNK